MSVVKEPVPKNQVFLFKLTIEEHFENDLPLIKAKFRLLDLIKSVHFFDTQDSFS